MKIKRTYWLLSNLRPASSLTIFMEFYIGRHRWGGWDIFGNTHYSKHQRQLIPKHF